MKMNYREFLKYVKDHPGCFETHDQRAKEFEHKVKMYLEKHKKNISDDEEQLYKDY